MAASSPLTMRLLFTLAFVTYLNRHHIQAHEEFERPEVIYRRAVAEWQNHDRRNWEVWLGLADVLVSQFTEADNRLEVIGGIEESILTIERYVFRGDDRTDPERDAALSKLYESYGKMLSWLTPSECVQLALDPHTLLIGADTVDKSGKQPPSVALCVENAENSLRNAVSLDATNRQAAKLLDSITGIQGSGHKRKPKEFVAELFDSFADSFDTKLGQLQYRVPKLVGTAVQTMMTEHNKGKLYKAALDAGCGTGLVGPYLRPLVSEVLIGVDVSQKMLQIAANCTRSTGCGVDQQSTDKPSTTDDLPLYDKLLSLDLDDMTLANTLQSLPQRSLSGFDLVVAADVFVYFGSLEHILGKFSSLSVPGSHLVFSCERATEAEAPLGWRLLTSGRFAHTKQHVVTMAAQGGYALVFYQDIVPRREKGEEVKGSLYGFVLRQEHDEHDEL